MSAEFVALLFRNNLQAMPLRFRKGINLHSIDDGGQRYYERGRVLGVVFVQSEIPRPDYNPQVLPLPNSSFVFQV